MKHTSRTFHHFLITVSCQWISSYPSILWLDEGGGLRDVEAVQELPDVLVLDVSGLLDEGGGLRDGLHGVTGQDQLVLLALVLTGHTGVHAHLPDVLLPE